MFLLSTVLCSVGLLSNTFLVILTSPSIHFHPFLNRQIIGDINQTSPKSLLLGLGIRKTDTTKVAKSILSVVRELAQGLW